MKKQKMMKLSMAAALVIGAMNVAHADNSVQVTGSVSSVTCAVSVDQPVLPTIKLKPADITAADTLYGTKTVAVTTSDCTGGVDSVSKPKLRVSGPVSSLGATYFNSESSPSFGIGIKVDGTNTILANNAEVYLGSVTTTPTDLEGGVTTFDIGVNSPTATPAAGLAKATMTFDFLYN